MKGRTSLREKSGYVLLIIEECTLGSLGECGTEFALPGLVNKALPVLVLLSLAVALPAGASPARSSRYVGKKAGKGKNNRSSVLVVMYRGPRFKPLSKRNLTAEKLRDAFAKRNRDGEVALLGHQKHPTFVGLTLAKRKVADTDARLVTPLGSFSAAGEATILFDRDQELKDSSADVRRSFYDHRVKARLNGERFIAKGISKLVARNDSDGVELTVRTSDRWDSQMQRVNLGRLENSVKVSGFFDLGNFGFLNKWVGKLRGYVQVYSSAGTIYVESLQIDPEWLSLGPEPETSQ